MQGFNIRVIDGVRENFGNDTTLFGHLHSLVDAPLFDSGNHDRYLADIALRAQRQRTRGRKHGKTVRFPTPYADFLGGRAAAAAAGTRAQADLLGQSAAMLGVVGGDHRIIGRQAPTLAILFGSQIVCSLEMPFEHLQFLAIFKADNVIGGNGLLDRDGRLGPFGKSAMSAERRKRTVDLADQLRRSPTATLLLPT